MVVMMVVVVVVVVVSKSRSCDGQGEKCSENVGE